jgi:hypothetical protein
MFGIAQPKFYVDKIVENENFEACKAYGEWNVV